MRVGSHTLADYPAPTVRIDCERCGRAGRYRLDGLVERVGADAALPDMLMGTGVMRTPGGLLPALRGAVHRLGGVNANTLRGVVTLRCEEARGIAPYGFSSSRDNLMPRTHRRGA